MRRISTIFASWALAAAAVAAGPEEISVKTLQAQMRYSVTEINVTPGAAVKILFENTDDMPHNLVFCQPGTDVVAMSARQLEKPDEAVKRNFLPEDPAIWMHSKLVGPHEKEELSFVAPEKPDDYPYVCTMPGHAMSMKGVLHVVAPGKGLTHLRFKLYLGEWDKLPDFSQLQPHREGDVPDNLVQLKFDDYKNNYGVVFDGKINAPKAGEYLFSLASDDGSRLSIDGKKVIDHDGVHPSESIKEAKVRLQAGDHDYHLEYFQKGGEAEIYAGWQGPNFSVTPLSKWLHPRWSGQIQKKKDEHTGMPLLVDKEPVVYRNFISDSSTRGIGVGYPGGFNITWSAQAMNLALVWRGAFIDAARHWTDRGGGYQAPLGYDVFRPAGEVATPFAVLASAGAEWPKLDRTLPAEGFQWKGYRLDAKRYPTFFYEWGAVKVSDRFDTEGSAAMGAGKLVRTLTLQGTIPQGAVLRIASGTIQPDGDSFGVDGGKINLDGHEFENKFVVTAVGATLSGTNLVVPASAQMKVVYGWPMDRLHAHAH